MYKLLFLSITILSTLLVNAQVRLSKNEIDPFDGTLTRVTTPIYLTDSITGKEYTAQFSRFGTSVFFTFIIVNKESFTIEKTDPIQIKGSTVIKLYPAERVYAKSHYNEDVYTYTGGAVYEIPRTLYPFFQTQPPTMLRAYYTSGIITITLNAQSTADLKKAFWLVTADDESLK